MRTLTLVPAAIACAVAGCTQPPSPPGAAFAQAVAGRTAGKPQTCVSEFGQDHPYVIDPQTIAYGYGKTIYINHLSEPCPGVEQMNILITETHGGMFCKGDHIRGAAPGDIIPGPVCFIGNWTPYTTR